MQSLPALLRWRQQARLRRAVSKKLELRSGHCGELMLAARRRERQRQDDSFFENLRRALGI